MERLDYVFSAVKKETQHRTGAPVIAGGQRGKWFQRD